MLVALTRSVPPSIVRCELTHLERAPIDAARAAAQHRQYEAALRLLGCAIEHLPDTPDLPDSVFVEDTAIVVDELAVITRPGAASRRAETVSVVQALAPFREIRTLTAPATMDGGDVLRVGRTLFVGLSSRTNEEGARQLAQAVEPFGYHVRPVEVRGCLHLKSAVTVLAEDLLIYNPQWIDVGAFGWKTVSVPADEPFAANVLRLDRGIVCAAAHRRTIEMLERLGYDVHPVDMSELAKAEAGVTCCSVIVRNGGA